MPEEQNTPAKDNVAAPTQPDVEAIVASAVAKAVAPLMERITALGEAQGKALTPDAVAQQVGDLLAQRQATEAAQATRAAYVSDKLKDLPKAYQDLMPQTADAAQLAAAEQQVRERYRTEIGDKQAAAAPNVGGTAGGQSPTHQVDLSKLTPTQLVERGLKERAATK